MGSPKDPDRVQGATVLSSNPGLRRTLVGCWGRSDVVVEGPAEVVEMEGKPDVVVDISDIVIDSVVGAEGSLMDSVVVALSETVIDRVVESEGSSVLVVKADVTEEREGLQGDAKADEHKASSWRVGYRNFMMLVESGRNCMKECYSPLAKKLVFPPNEYEGV